MKVSEILFNVFIAILVLYGLYSLAMSTVNCDVTIYSMIPLYDGSYNYTVYDVNYYGIQHLSKLYAYIPNSWDLQRCSFSLPNFSVDKKILRKKPQYKDFYGIE